MSPFLELGWDFVPASMSRSHRRNHCVTSEARSEKRHARPPYFLEAFALGIQRSCREDTQVTWRGHMWEFCPAAPLGPS